MEGQVSKRIILLEAEVADDGRVTGVFWTEPQKPMQCATCKWAERPNWDADTFIGDPIICQRQCWHDAKMDSRDHIFVAPDFGCVQWEKRYAP